MNFLRFFDARVILQQRAWCTSVLVGLFSVSAIGGNDFIVTKAGSPLVYKVQSSNSSKPWNPLPIPSQYGPVYPLISTPPGTIKPSWANTHTLEFEFQTPNYFSQYPNGSLKSGHFGVFVRGDLFTGGGNPLYRFRGHGVTIGNIQGYGTPVNGGFVPFFNLYNNYCSDPSLSGANNTVTIEVAGFIQAGQDNCVFGESHSPELYNNIRYKISVHSQFNDSTGLYSTAYSISRLDVVYGWVAHGSSWLRVYPYWALDPTLGGWFIVEGFSPDSPWIFNIFNLAAYWH